MVKNTNIGKFGKVKFDISKLLHLQKSLKVRYVARVGILGQKAKGRKEVAISKSGKRSPGKSLSELSNADIGLIHEKGVKSKKIPRRSFLEYPLTTKLPAAMNKVGKALMDDLNSENLEKTYKQLGLVGEGIVLKAFGTRGYGTWPKNSPATIARKGSSQPLIDTAQLRKSISSQVVKKGEAY